MTVGDDGILRPPSLPAVPAPEPDPRVTSLISVTLPTEIDEEEQHRLAEMYPWIRIRPVDSSSPNV